MPTFVRTNAADAAMPLRAPRADPDSHPRSSVSPRASGMGGEARLRRPTPIQRLPLRWKLAGAHLIGLATGVGVVALILHHLGGQGPPPPASPVALSLSAGVLSGLVVAVGLAAPSLRPLAGLLRASRRIRDGDLAARAPLSCSRFAGPDLRRLVRTFNRAIDGLEREEGERRGLALSVLRAEERARKRIAHDLYDDPAQRLAAILLHLSSTGEGAEQRGGSASSGTADLPWVRREIGLALDSVRRLARRLRPPELDELGLVPALEAEARIAEESTAGRIRVVAEGPEVVPGEEERLVLFRILQEGLANAVEHAEASRIELRLIPAGPDGELVAEVTDDGRGFDPAIRGRGSAPGRGLRAMRERAASIGAALDVESRPGGGTTVRLRLPSSGGPGEG